MTWKFPMLMIAIAISSMVACGGDDEAKSGTCEAICDCVHATYGTAVGDCRPTCDSVKSDHAGDEAACESALDSYSYADCKSECSGF